MYIYIYIYTLITWGSCKVHAFKVYCLGALGLAGLRIFEACVNKAEALTPPNLNPKSETLNPKSESTPKVLGGEGVGG